MHRYARGHRPTRSLHWAATDRPYTVEYKEVRMAQGVDLSGCWDDDVFRGGELYVWSTSRCTWLERFTCMVAGMIRCGRGYFVGEGLYCAVAGRGQDEICLDRECELAFRCGGRAH